MMFRNLHLACIAAVLSVSTLAPSPVSADNQISHYRSKGNAAEAYFYEVDPTGCIYMETYLSVLEGRVSYESGPPEASTRISFVSSDFDACVDRYISVLYGFTDIPSHDFRTRGLASASLQTTIIAENRRPDGFFYVPVTFDLLWTGEGEMGRNGMRVERHRVPGFSYMQRFTGTSRGAGLSGSIAFESRNLADAEFIDAVLVVRQDAVTTIVFDSN
jgi:hypothetical protein